MKNPKEFYSDLTAVGKVFSWWIIPMYYLAHLLLGVVGVALYGLFAVIQEIKGEY